MSQAVQDILERIEHLSEDDRIMFEEQLTKQLEEDWKRETREARILAERRGIDQAAIDEAVECLRYE